MTHDETLAYNAGIAQFAALAAQAAQAMRARETLAPTRYPFATAALQALADEAVHLTIPVQPVAGDEAR